MPQPERAVSVYVNGTFSTAATVDFKVIMHCVFCHCCERLPSDAPRTTMLCMLLSVVVLSRVEPVSNESSLSDNAAGRRLRAFGLEWSRGYSGFSVIYTCFTTGLSVRLTFKRRCRGQVQTTSRRRLCSSPRFQS